MQLRSLILAASLMVAPTTYAHVVQKDTLTHHMEVFEADSLFTEENIASDSLVSNDEAFYNNIWNSTQIKYPLNTLPPNDEMVMLTLTQVNDHPFVNPVIGNVISRFGKRSGRMHTGTDIKINSGDTIRCAFDGKVRLAKRFSGYGNMVVVRHKNGLETLYAHLKAIKVNINDSIKAGDLIGLGGRTGRATCDHLHFETRLFGEPFNSEKYIDFRNYCLKSNHIYYKNKQFEIDPAHFDRKHLPAPKPALAENVNHEVNDSTILAASNKVTSSAKSAGANTTASKGTSAKATKHVIRKGDNLWSMAKKYNTTVKKLCLANNITAHKTLKVGSVLKIN